MLIQAGIWTNDPGYIKQWRNGAENVMKCINYQLQILQHEDNRKEGRRWKEGREVREGWEVKRREDGRAGGRENRSEGGGRENEGGMAREVGMEEESKKGREREGKMKEREGGKRELWSIDILGRQDQELTKSDLKNNQFLQLQT